jgi:alpha-amylase
LGRSECLFPNDDRFNNGDTSNDITSTETKQRGNFVVLKVAISKGFLKKLTKVILIIRINAIWFTPIVEQIHDGVDEGTGLSYGFMAGPKTGPT